MARIPKLDAAGKFLAADVNAQIDARTKATMRTDLPALAKELKIGGSGVEQVSGTVTLDASGDPIREFFTTGATTFNANGTTTSLGAYTAVVWRRSASGSWGYQVVQEAWTTPAATPDTTAPVAGTLAVTVTGTTATLTVSGASDDRSIQSYEWSKDGGTTWPARTTGPSHTFTGLAPSTSYTWRHRVTDGTNVTLGVPITKATTEHIPAGAYDDAVLADAPLYYWPLDDPAGSTSARNLGSAASTTSSVAGVTFGAAGLGDGPTSASFDGTGSVALTGPTAPAMTASSMEVIYQRNGGGGIPNLVYLFGDSWSIKLYSGFTYKCGSSTYVASGTTLPAGRAHLAAVWNGAEVIFYVNGSEVSRKAYTSTFNGGTFGGSLGSGGYVGSLAGVAAYNKALTPDRVLAHAKAAGLA